MRASSVSNAWANSSCSSARSRGQRARSPSSMARLARPWALPRLGPARQPGRARSLQLVVGHHLVDQADAQRLVGPHLAAGQDQVLGPGRPHQPGRRWVPPPPGMTPSSTSGWPKRAFSGAMRRSHARASSQPPHRAKPDTAAMTHRGMAPATRRAHEGAAHLPGLVGATELASVGAGLEQAVAAGHDHGAGRNGSPARRRRPRSGAAPRSTGR